MPNPIESKDYTQGSRNAANMAQALSPLSKLFEQLRSIQAEKELETQKGQQTESQEKLKAYLQGQEQATSIDRLGEMMKSAPAGSGGAVGPGGASFTKPTNYAALGSTQAREFLKSAQAAYKGINDQLDASRATIDNLNLGNSTGDKLALLNEARLALAGSGGRAFGAVMAQLSGDPSMASDSQKAMNWIQNTPNLPTMQPAQRDAIRESVFGRLPQLQQQHQQRSAALMQQAPVVAPMADTNSLIGSITAPVDQNLKWLSSAQNEYKAKRTGMGQQPAVSNPTTADANPTTLDRLKGLFRVGGAPAPQPTPAQPDQDPIAAELAKRAQGALQQQSQPQGQ